MKLAHSKNKADYIGIAGSILCIIHCLLVPAALAFSTSFGHAHQNGFTLFSLDMVFIAVNGIAVFYATRDHKNTIVRIMLWSGLLIFSASLILEGIVPFFAWLSYFGSGLLIAGHILNLYLCQIAPRLKYKTF